MINKFSEHKRRINTLSDSIWTKLFVERTVSFFFFIYERGNKLQTHLFCHFKPFYIRPCPHESEHFWKRMRIQKYPDTCVP